MRFVESHDAIAVAHVRGAAQQQPVDEPEHRGVGTDPQRQNGDHHPRESRASAEPARGDAHVVHRGRQPLAVARRSRVPRMLARDAPPRARDVPEPALGLAPSLVRREARADELLDAEREMKPDLLVELGGDRPAAEAEEPLVAGAHVARRAAVSTAVTAPA